MNPEPDLSTIAALIGEPSRAIMLSALLGGQSLPASELAYRAHITAQTASSHLSKLVDGGLLAVQRTGRHRYYQLKNADVGHLLEAMAVIAPPARTKTPHESEAMKALCSARTCYDHLAGKLGVAITQSLLDKAFIHVDDVNYQITNEGSRWLAAWKIDENQLEKADGDSPAPASIGVSAVIMSRGALGAALAAALFENGWVKRVEGTRAIGITDKGRTGLAEQFAIHTQDW